MASKNLRARERTRFLAEDRQFDVFLRKLSKTRGKVPKNFSRYAFECMTGTRHKLDLVKMLRSYVVALQSNPDFHGDIYEQFARAWNNMRFAGGYWQDRELDVPSVSAKELRHAGRCASVGREISSSLQKPYGLLEKYSRETG